MPAITPDQVRKLAVHKQMLAGPRPEPNLQGLKQVMEMIRCLQIDPIRAVERTQYLVLFSRLGPYKQEILEKAAYSERFLFEFWAHAASYVLTEDYPIHNHMMRNVNYGNGAWGKRIRSWLAANQEFEAYVLGMIEKNGPTLSSEIDDRSIKPWKSGGWSSDRNANLMITNLWDRGLIAVSNRDGLKKYWDLAERVHPGWMPQEVLAPREVTERAVPLSIKGLGAATAKQIKNHFTRSRYPELEAVLEQLEADRTILRLELEGAEDAWHKSGPWFMHREDLPLLEKIKNGGWQGRTTLLSPFDNMIADRERTELLWDFFFRIEIYVPPHKREYGYYVMPILHEDRLIGRIDPKMDRKTGILHIQSVHKEPEVHTSADMLRSVRAAIDDLAAFLNAGEVLFSDHLPAEWKGIAEK